MPAYVALDTMFAQARRCADSRTCDAAQQARGGEGVEIEKMFINNLQALFRARGRPSGHPERWL